MRKQFDRSRFGRLTCVRALSLWALAFAMCGIVRGEERQFLVILANSPKQYPGPRSNPELLGKPTQGLLNRQIVTDQYFDKVRPDIGSFAEYWEEISYGDVRIHGFVTDWINLPWAIQPPLVDAGRDGGESPPVDDILDNPAQRRTPAAFYDIDGSGTYSYGTSERFNNFRAGAILDLNGDFNNTDDGPSSAGIGGGHFTATANGDPGFPVWKPGERFVDMDGDNRWDGLDEVNNTNDFNFDGMPDGLGPWNDLNNNGEPDNAGGCQYLPDFDNDGNPDCCPNGPGKPSCARFGFPGGANACPPTSWEGMNGEEVIDCNGNMVPDACDLGCGRPACLALQWPGPCGGSKDELPFEGEDGACVAGEGDDIPDECQFVNHAVANGCVQELDIDPQGDCFGVPECLPLPAGARDPQVRCEYFDSNIDEELNIVEPFENFIRRWDPCINDPDSAIFPPARVAHWVKVYDPNSDFANVTLRCDRDGREFKYGDPSYIEDNYPGRAKLCETSKHPCNADGDCPPTAPVPNKCKTGVQILIEEASGRTLYGEHDPLGKIQVPEICLCPSPGPDGTKFCQSVTVDGQFIPNACVAGFSRIYNPPDSFSESIADNQPGGVDLFTTKMQAQPQETTAGILLEWTPKPGTGAGGGFQDQAWYEQSWSDRYNAIDCENENFNPSLPQGGSNTRRKACIPPNWPGTHVSPARQDNSQRLLPFVDVQPDAYNEVIHRRNFRANAGGLNGDGTGWIGCNQTVDGGVIFSTGDFQGHFARHCNQPILPDEVDGPNLPGRFFDGWVEHDDLPSSKYHRAGDQRLGEVTSPFSNNIWGEDRGIGVSSAAPADLILPAAGPYAVSVHGNNGRDAGNQLITELLTWRTTPPFNNGYAWELEQANWGIIRFHPYAGVIGDGANMGFRDYNLDGLVDQGEVRPVGSENYVSDSVFGTVNDGISSAYPFHRDRIMEDCIEILDDLVDFDDFVDPVSMNAVTCGGGGLSWLKPGQFLNVDADNPDPDDVINDPLNIIHADGICSGIVLMGPGAFRNGQLNRAPNFIPIHNQDYSGTADAFPQVPFIPGGLSPSLFKPRLSWNIFFHNLIWAFGAQPRGEGSVPLTDAQTVFAAHEWLHSWQSLPDLYDYDVYAPLPRPPENCPVAGWDIMANGGLVHPSPILKEDVCTQWLKGVDLATVLTPGINTTITLPRYEFVRDDSVYFLENENRPREKFWFWSVGTGFDTRMAGDGMLIMHTDPDASNPEALPSGQANGTRFYYHIIQADAQSQLDNCENRGDAGDPWPGSTNKQKFGLNTNPSARWYTQNSWTGIEVESIIPDGEGSVQMRLNWIPTGLPSLKFTDPPGGVSVPVNANNVRYRARFLASDVFGGTTIRMYYTQDPDNISISSANFVGELRKTTPGANEMSIDWNIASRADGRYWLFAELIPGAGADGNELASTSPRAGRNNLGNGSLTVDQVNIAAHKARLETWTAVCIKADGTEWKVNSSLTQPISLPDAANLHATTGQQYTSLNGAVKFTIRPGSKTFALDDTFTFTTTGITAISEGLVIIDGQIKEDPTARIVASPLSGDPPLTVQFDGRTSSEPNGEPLTFRWTFGDGSTDNTPNPTHMYTRAGKFTAVLRATNPSNGRFGEAAIDIDVTNNSPNAVILASPVSGGAPLTVTFNAGQSSDLESAANKLIYQWNFGDGQTANDAAVPGTLSQITHFYTKTASGQTCTTQNPCLFTAALTVTDEGGKTDTDTVQIRVGNTNPVANITATPLQGPAPLEVVFNALNSTDVDNDVLKIDWNFGDGQTLTNVPKTGEQGATDGTVRHIYTNTGTYNAKATVKDGRGGEAVWAGVTITVIQGTQSSSEPRAIFTITPISPKLNQEFTVDGSDSFDNPGGGPVASYTWDWGDRTALGSGSTSKHTYTAPGRYIITLTVADAASPPNTGRMQRTVLIGSGDEGEEPEDNDPPLAVFLVSPGVEAFVNETLTFDARGSSDPNGDELRYMWNFGDGTETLFSSTPTASHSFSEIGTYLVRLSVRDEFNATTNSTQTVRVLEQGENRTPTAMIATGPRNIVQGQTITFDGGLSSDPDGDPLIYSWTFAFEGNTDDVLTGSEVTKVFTQVGRYTVDLEVSDPDGKSASAETEEIVVRATGTEPPPEEPPPQENPDEEPPDSAGQRPPGLRMCGLGMLPALLMMLACLTLVRGMVRTVRRSR